MLVRAGIERAPLKNPITAAQLVLGRFAKRLFRMVARDGVEPPTRGCSVPACIRQVGRVVLLASVVIRSLRDIGRHFYIQIGPERSNRTEFGGNGAGNIGLGPGFAGRCSDAFLTDAQPRVQHYFEESLSPHSL